MPVVWTPLALVGPLPILVGQAMSLTGTAQRYRRKCRLLHGRVQGIANHLSDLQRSQSTPDPPAMQETLKNLEKVLHRALKLAQSCQRKKKAFDFLRARKNTGEFAFLNEEITNLVESFHVANRILIMGLYSDQIFLVVLRMLLQSEAGRRVLQLEGNRAVVERCINPNTRNNMSPEKIEVLELIKRNLRPGQRGAAEAASYESEIRHIDNIARDIVLKADAVNHNREEVQRLALLARHLLYFLPNVRFPPLSQHPETPRHLTRLWQELRGAHQTIMSRPPTIMSRPPVICGGPAGMVTSTSSFWRDQARSISGHANSIELCLQRLTFIALNDLLRNNA